VLKARVISSSRGLNGLLKRGPFSPAVFPANRPLEFGERFRNGIDLRLG
jgi:hypothetical protein